MKEYRYVSQLAEENAFAWDHVEKFGHSFDLTIDKHGCGLCSLSMVVENLTGKPFPLQEAAKMAKEWNYGASGPTLCEMKVLAPVAAETFGLRFACTSREDELMEWLEQGGMAIAHSNGDRPGHVGVLSHGKHYVAVAHAGGGKVLVLDPSLTGEKYREAGREQVTVDGNLVYMDSRVLWEDCEGKIPRFYLFACRPE